MSEPSAPGLVSKHRIEALSDGLYAIALTLLVLDLKVPALSPDATNAALIGALRDLLPRLLAWILSFWVMGILWLGQVRAFRLVHAVSWPMLRVQLLVLAGVSVMPFSTALLSEHGHQSAAAVVYAANLAAIGALGLLHTTLLVRDPRVHAQPLGDAARRRLVARSATMLACSAACLVLAFVVPMWNLLPMLLLLLRRAEEQPSPVVAGGPVS